MFEQLDGKKECSEIYLADRVVNFMRARMIADLLVNFIKRRSSVRHTDLRVLTRYLHLRRL